VDSPRVLVACEFSATVRDAFRARGFDAWSVDLLPTEGDPAFHIQADASVVVGDGWDLMVAHPPCTFLTKAGVRWLHTQEGRRELMVQDAKFFRSFLDAPVPLIAVENPVMHRYATEIIGRRQDQLVQPWMFGHQESKGTGFWLKGLPPLQPTDNVREATMALTPRQRDRIHWAAPGPDRWKVRSRTYVGIATAMADQWGGVLRSLVTGSKPSDGELA
jgi:hypothetical protein